MAGEQRTVRIRINNREDLLEVKRILDKDRQEASIQAQVPALAQEVLSR